MSVSVLTIVRGRRKHLLNQLKGLTQSRHRPSEWIVVGMDEDVELPSTDRFKIRTARVEAADNQLPLAAARNRSAELASGSNLIFLDVDCVPSTNMIEHFVHALQQRDALWMGQVGYLPANFEICEHIDDLKKQAFSHPLQPNVAAGHTVLSREYEKFWSLCFAISKSNFQTIGGFDATFAGYGGEDTDFAFSARSAGVAFGFVGAQAFHQHHSVHKPPLNHFDAILANAVRFHQKWDVGPMMSWLNEFQNAGLIDMDLDAGTIERLRSPTSAEIERTKVSSPAGF